MILPVLFTQINMIFVTVLRDRSARLSITLLRILFVSTIDTDLTQARIG